MLLLSFSSNATPRICLATAALLSNGLGWRRRRAGVLLLWLVFLRLGVRDLDQRLGRLPVLLQEGGKLRRRGRRGSHRLLVEERLELGLAEQPSKLVRKPLDNCRRRAARRCKTPPAVPWKARQAGFVQGRHIRQQRRALRHAD